MINLKEILKEIKPIDIKREIEKKKELDSLLKTPKGLGKLETLAIQLEGIEEGYTPRKKMVLVMAADNGVEREGVSKSKRVITRYVVEAMVQGKSSINALGNVFGADVRVVDLGIDETSDENNKTSLKGVIDRKLMPLGTDNMTEGAAMSYEVAQKAIETGIEIINTFKGEGYNLFAAGEMGIGNTTTSSAVLKVFTELSLDDIVGYGSGIDDRTLEHKKKVIKKAIEANRCLGEFDLEDPIDVLAKVGGLDIAGMTGIFLGCALNKVPVVIDGLISAVAAYLAYRICPESKGYMIASHLSEEPGMKYIMKELGLEPSLYMNMKLGEGSGAVMMFSVIEGAVNITKTVRKYPKV